MLSALAGRPDIVLVSLGTTIGLRVADEAFVRQVRAAGATCALAPVQIGVEGRLRVSMALTDAVEAVAARRAARGVVGTGAGPRAGAIVYSSVTAALLQPTRAPAAVRFDAIAAQNRAGAGGAWQRRRERTVLGRVSLLLPWSEAAAQAALIAARPGAPPAVVLPPPVAPGTSQGGRGASEGGRGAGGGATAASVEPPDAVAYAGNPHKRGVDLLCEAWSAARPEGARMAVAGLTRGEALSWLRKAGSAEPPGVEWLGAVPHERWLALVAGARVFVNASRHEDWGLAQMEALAAGTPLVTVPSGGTGVALPLARRLAPALVAPDRSAAALAAALRTGLGLDLAARRAYAREAARLLEPYRDEALSRRVADEVLPVLLGSSA